MPTYAYQVVDGGGKQTRGVSNAASAAALTRTLEDRGLMVLEVNETKAEAAASGGGFKFGSGRREVLEFTRAMGSLLPVGMPLAQALNAAAGVCTGEVNAAVIDVRERVERGEQLADALAEHRRFFPPLYEGLVRAGERSGDLDTAFVRLTQQLERDEELRSKITSAAVYPIILAVAGTLAVFVLMYFVIPKFLTALSTDPEQLPGTTRLVVSLSEMLRQYWYICLAIPAAFMAFLAWTRNSEDGQRVMSRLLLSLPGVKTLRQYAIAARFARLMGVLLGGGAPLLTALDDTVESLTDPIAKDDAVRIRARVREGVSLRAAVAEGGLFPPLLTQLIGVGEDAGELRIFLVKSAEIFEERTERAATRLSTMLEPLMIIFFGGLVMFVALALMQAIYSMNAGAL